jgi:hypothetical protein
MYHWDSGTMTWRATGREAREPVPVIEIQPGDALALAPADGDMNHLSEDSGADRGEG